MLINILFLVAFSTLVFMLSIQYKIFRLTNWLICFHSKSKGISPFEAILIKTVSRVTKIGIISKALGQKPDVAIGELEQRLTGNVFEFVLVIFFGRAKFVQIDSKLFDISHFRKNETLKMNFVYL